MVRRCMSHENKKAMHVNITVYSMYSVPAGQGLSPIVRVVRGTVWDAKVF